MAVGHGNSMHRTETILKDVRRRRTILITDVITVRNWSLQELTGPLLYMYTVIRI